jgi:hypothetical protein
LFACLLDVDFSQEEGFDLSGLPHPERVDNRRIPASSLSF